MMHSFRRLLMVLPLLIGAVATSGQGTGDVDTGDPGTVAQHYLNAVEAMDWPRMASLLHPEAIFEDPTAETFGEPWRVEGGENIVAFYRGQAEGSDTLGTRYRALDTFTTGDRTVFDLEIDVRLTAGMIGFPDDIIEDTMRVITVITVKEGLVVHHIDYADYADMFRRLDGHQERLEKRGDTDGA